MGCFHMKDFVTGQAIHNQDEIVAFVVSDNFDSYPVSTNKVSNGCYPNNYFSFTSLPIHGRYGDYGNVEPHDYESISIKLLCDYFGLKDFEEINNKLLGREKFVCENKNINQNFGITMIHKRTFELLTEAKHKVVRKELNFEEEYEIFESKLKKVHEVLSNKDNLTIAQKRELLSLAGIKFGYDFFDLRQFSHKESETISSLFMFSENSYYDSHLQSQFQDKNFCGFGLEESVKNGTFFNDSNNMKKSLNELYVLRAFYQGLAFLHMQIIPSSTAGQENITLNSLFLHIDNVIMDYDKYMSDAEEYFEEDSFEEVNIAINRLENVLSKMKNRLIEVKSNIKEMENEDK